MSEIVNIKWLYNEGEPLYRGSSFIWDYNTYYSYIHHSFKYNPIYKNTTYVYSREFNSTSLYNLIKDDPFGSIGRIVSMNFFDGVCVEIDNTIFDKDYFKDIFISIYFIIDDNKIIPLKLFICRKGEDGNILYI